MTPAFALKEAGVYVVELIARDKLGRVQTLNADLYVGGQTPVAWKKPRQGVFELATDKPKYRPGDTARIIIQSPFQQGRALVVVEEPGGNTYTWREVSGGKAVYELPIKGEPRPEHPGARGAHARAARGGEDGGRALPAADARGVDRRRGGARAQPGDGGAQAPGDGAARDEDPRGDRAQGRAAARRWPAR